jgi:hypothetical protein
MAKQERRPTLLLPRKRRGLATRGPRQDSPILGGVFILLIVGLMGMVVVLVTLLR